VRVDDVASSEPSATGAITSRLVAGTKKNVRLQVFASPS
jgi:hypothetical protein